MLVISSFVRMVTAFKGITWFFDWKADCIVPKCIYTGGIYGFNRLLFHLNSQRCTIRFNSRFIYPKHLETLKTIQRTNFNSFQKLWNVLRSPRLESISHECRKLSWNLYNFLHFWFDAILYQISPFLKSHKKKRDRERERAKAIAGIIYFPYTFSISWL